MLGLAALGRFLPPTTQAKVIRFKTVVYRYLRYLTLYPSSWNQFLRLLRTPPKSFRLNFDPNVPIKIACVLDEFSFESFRFDANFLQLHARTWREQVESFNPQMILVESVWRGKEASWYKKVSDISNEIIGLADWADTHNIPIVFWHKEVPPHISTFMHVSKLFDHIFLTDADCIDEYREKVGHDQVHFLSFACQPKIHNPIEESTRKNAMIYAGTFYPEYKYPDRYKNFMDLMEGLSPLVDIDIYDRSAGKGVYTFPKQFHSRIKGSLPFAAMSKAYRTYDYGLNMNSVKNSNTMCSRRVFELIACNTIVVGNYSKAVRNMFEDLTICSDDRDEIIEQFKRLQNDIDYRHKVRLKALRKTMEEHTYRKRLTQIIEQVQPGAKSSDPHVAVIARGNEKEIQNITQQFKKQSYANKELLIYKENIQLPLNTTHFCFMDAHWTYGVDYLKDMMLAFEYNESRAVTKRTHFDSNLKTIDDGFEYRYVERAQIAASVFIIEAYPQVMGSQTAVDLRALSIDKFNLCFSNGNSLPQTAIDTISA